MAQNDNLRNLPLRNMATMLAGGLGGVLMRQSQSSTRLGLAQTYTSLELQQLKFR